jgi:hypothetical protein
MRIRLLPVSRSSIIHKRGRERASSHHSVSALSYIPPSSSVRPSIRYAALLWSVISDFPRYLSFHRKPSSYYLIYSLSAAVYSRRYRARIVTIKYYSLNPFLLVGMHENSILHLSPATVFRLAVKEMYVFVHADILRIWHRCNCTL